MGGISIDRAREGILFLIALVLSISVHEFGHAWFANRLGDPLPRSQGRVTLSPMAHIDPIGTLLMPIMGFFTGLPLLGWGRPVQTSPVSYNRRFSMRTGHMLVAASGPAMNLIMATIVSAMVVVGGRLGIMPPSIAEPLIRYMVLLNLSLMFFNLLPIPPLDGGAVMAGLLPESLQYIPRFLERYGFIILVGLLITGLLSVLMIPADHISRLWLRGLVGLAYS